MLASPVTTKHLTFTRLPLQKNRRTSTWSVWNHDYNERLGELAWYSPWRQFCFLSPKDSVFSSGCLLDITNMLQRLKEEA